MEVATADFVKGLRYISAAIRCEEWSGDDDTESKLSKLAREYRHRAATLMVGEILGTAAGEEDTAVPLLDPWENQQTRATGGRGL